MFSLPLQKHERQAQQHYQQLQRRKREEEERQRQAEHMARRERERDDSKGDSSGDHHHDKSHGSKSRSGGGGGGGGAGSDKPKRPSSLLANNNVMKLKQIIPLQSKFSSGGARSPQSPTGSEPKLPGFLSFKFLKSPENKREGAAGSVAAAVSATATAAASSSSLSGSSSQERSQSPNKAFNPGKLFNFGKSEGGTCVNGAPLPRSGEGSSSQTSERQPSRSDLNGVPDEIPSPGGEGSENGHSSDLDSAGSKI